MDLGQLPGDHGLPVPEYLLGESDKISHPPGRKIEDQSRLFIPEGHKELARFFVFGGREAEKQEPVRREPGWGKGRHSRRRAGDRNDLYSRFNSLFSKPVAGVWDS